MPRSNKSYPAGAAPDMLFTSRKANDRTPLTHETIAKDLEAFRKAGGKIEVLGTTRSLQRIDIDPTASPPAPARPTPSRHRS